MQQCDIQIICCDMSINHTCNSTVRYFDCRYLLYMQSYEVFDWLQRNSTVIMTNIYMTDCDHLIISMFLMSTIDCLLCYNIFML